MTFCGSYSRCRDWSAVCDCDIFCSYSLFGIRSMFYADIGNDNKRVMRTWIAHLNPGPEDIKLFFMHNSTEH